MGIVGNAQQCLTDVIVEEALKDNPALKHKLAVQQQQLKEYIKRSSHKTTGIRYISVVIHVLYSTDQENIPEGQAKSGIYVLNQCFRGANPDLASTPTDFQQFIADMEIEFCLAAVDEWGNPTTGITRHEVPGNFDAVANYNKPAKGGVAAWDPTRYLNIWVADLTPGLLGLGWPPGVTVPDADGVLVSYKCIGSIGTSSSNAPFHMGKTLVHEVGHYLGLSHIWGNKQGCNGDDGIKDTPPQDKASSGCNTYPQFDACSSAGYGIMFVNFMDYSNDYCSLMFTHGQKKLVNGTLYSARSGLGSPTRCFPVSAKSIERSEGLSIAPNPTKGILHISSSKTIEQLTLINMVGRVCKEIHPQARTYDVDMSTLPSGVYFVKLNNNEVYKVIKK